MLVTGGGLETTIIFKRGIELPLFASFELLNDDEGIAALRSYHEPFLELAERHGVGAIVDTPTWRANSDWAERLGYSPEELNGVIRRAVEFARRLPPAQADARGGVGELPRNRDRGVRRRRRRPRVRLDAHLRR